MNCVSLSLEMNLTCYCAPILPWRIWRARSSKFMTPVWPGWMVRVAGVWLLPDWVLVAVEVQCISPGWNWACVPPAMQLSVALLTHNSPSKLSVQRRKWLCAPEKGTSCPSASAATSLALSWTTALWWVTAVRLMKTGNRFQYRLAHNEGQLDKLSSQ